MKNEARFTMTIEFEIDDVDDNLTRDEWKEVSEFVIEALECWGGQRHPDDWLFGSLEKVAVVHRRILKP